MNVSDFLQKFRHCRRQYTSYHPLQNFSAFSTFLSSCSPISLPALSASVTLLFFSFILKKACLYAARRVFLLTKSFFFLPILTASHVTTPLHTQLSSRARRRPAWPRESALHPERALCLSFSGILRIPFPSMLRRFFSLRVPLSAHTELQVFLSHFSSRPQLHSQALPVSLFVE